MDEREKRREEELIMSEAFECVDVGGYAREGWEL